MGSHGAGRSAADAAANAAGCANGRFAVAQLDTPHRTDQPSVAGSASECSTT